MMSLIGIERYTRSIVGRQSRLPSSSSIVPIVAFVTLSLPYFLLASWQAALAPKIASFNLLSAACEAAILVVINELPFLLHSGITKPANFYHTCSMLFCLPVHQYVYNIP